MKKYLLGLLVFSASMVSFKNASAKSELPGGSTFKSLLPQKLGNNSSNRQVDSIYQKMHLQAFGLKKDIFYNAFKGYEYLKSRGMLDKENILTIADYSQSSHNRRLYVIDFEKGELVFNTYVSHGKNSGGEFANSFSNSDNSNKSSCGFLVTGEPYSGRAGRSLHLKGVEPGINDHVYRRSIVLHGSYYVNSERADEGTMMGRSLGCPAVPYGEQFAIINYIKGGSCMFIATEDTRYLASSKILNSAFESGDSKTLLADKDNSKSSKGLL